MPFALNDYNRIDQSGSRFYLKDVTRSIDFNVCTNQTALMNVY